MATVNSEDLAFIARQICVIDHQFKAAECYLTTKQFQNARTKANNESWKLSRAIRRGIAEAVDRGYIQAAQTHSARNALKSTILGKIMNDKSLHLDKGLPRHHFDALRESFQILAAKTLPPDYHGSDLSHPAYPIPRAIERPEREDRVRAGVTTPIDNVSSPRQFKREEEEQGQDTRPETESQLYTYREPQELVRTDPQPASTRKRAKSLRPESLAPQSARPDSGMTEHAAMKSLVGVTVDENGSIDLDGPTLVDSPTQAERELFPIYKGGRHLEDLQDLGQILISRGEVFMKLAGGSNQLDESLDVIDAEATEAAESDSDPSPDGDEDAKVADDESDFDLSPKDEKDTEDVHEVCLIERTDESLRELNAAEYEEDTSDSDDDQEMEDAPHRMATTDIADITGSSPTNEDDPTKIVRTWVGNVYLLKTSSPSIGDDSAEAIVKVHIKSQRVINKLYGMETSEMLTIFNRRLQELQSEILDFPQDIVFFNCDMVANGNIQILAGAPTDEDLCRLSIITELGDSFEETICISRSPVYEVIFHGCLKPQMDLSTRKLRAGFIRELYEANKSSLPSLREITAIQDTIWHYRHKQDRQPLLAIRLTKPEVANEVLDKGLLWQGKRFRCSPKDPELKFIQCEICQGIGHGSCGCKRQRRCARCGSGKHRLRTCMSPSFKCANCKGAHDSRDPHCPAIKKAKLVFKCPIEPPRPVPSPPIPQVELPIMDAKSKPKQEAPQTEREAEQKHRKLHKKDSTGVESSEIANSAQVSEAPLPLVQSSTSCNQPQQSLPVKFEDVLKRLDDIRSVFCTQLFAPHPSTVPSKKRPHEKALMSGALNGETKEPKRVKKTT